MAIKMIVKLDIIDISKNATILNDSPYSSKCY